MKKALIVTWYNNYNYGTALQACSLKKVLENPKCTRLEVAQNCEFNLECSFLPHRAKKKLNLGRKIKKIFKLSAYKEKRRQYEDMNLMEEKREFFEIREKAFERYLKENVKLAAEHNIQSRKELLDMGKKFDLYVAGSDQIWNPVNLDDTYLLGWVDKDKKKISYASSLSIKEIPSSYHKKYRKALKDFKAVSIRDKQCQQQLENIVGRSVTTVADPVVLLGANELRNSCIPIDSSNYVFSYFLGQNIEHREYVCKFSKENNREIKSMIGVSGANLKSDRILEEFADWDVDPWKFVSYIYHSDFVITDSFHATVIAVLLHKNFVVLEKDKTRPEQNNRIREFLSVVGLEDRWNYIPDSMEEVKIENHRWEQADCNINQTRETSFHFLKKAILE